MRARIVTVITIQSGIEKIYSDVAPDCWVQTSRNRELTQEGLSWSCGLARDSSLAQAKKSDAPRLTKRRSVAAG